MARRVFFSFHYEDVKSFRVNVVRNSSMFKASGDTSRVQDASMWEEARLRGDAKLKALIDENLRGTSVTAVLVGESTHSRRWVKYELVKSFVKGNAILAIHLNRIRERTTSAISRKGLNPLERLAVYVSDDYQELVFLERVNGRWQEFALHPRGLNNECNSIFFEQSFWGRIGLGNKAGGIVKFSEIFNTYCWIKDRGSANLAGWIEDALVVDTHTL